VLRSWRRPTPEPFRWGHKPLCSTDAFSHCPYRGSAEEAGGDPRAPAAPSLAGRSVRFGARPPWSCCETMSVMFSEIEHGANMTFARQPVPDRPSQSPQPSPSHPAATFAYSVLTTTPSRTLIRDILEGAGYTVLLASDGETGLNLARQEQPDLGLLDLVLPGPTASTSAPSSRAIRVLRTFPF